MATVINGITMSLDGFINDKDGDVGQLYSDFSELSKVTSFQKTIEETGAVVMGKHSFEMGAIDSWGEYEFQVPIFVLTHTPPEKRPLENGKISFTFVTDGVESAITQARKAAGDKLVQIVGGASTFQQVLNAGLCDEVHLDIMPVIFGAGLRLFENIDTSKIKLELLSAEQATSARTSLKFKVIKL